MPAAINRVGELVVRWGESLRWDDVRQRLYFVDCAKKTLHWLEGGEPPLHTLELDSLPTGLVLTRGRELIVCLDGGLHVVDPDAGTSELLVAYPEGMCGRANDANADGSGNLVTGTLNLRPGPGAFWWFSLLDGWRLLDDGIGNANGPVVIDIDGQSTLVFGDTLARSIYAYDYDGRAGTVGGRRLFADHGALGGAPDGATADSDGGVWSCVLHSGKLARFTAAGLDRLLDLPMPNPSDVAFGGRARDRLFVTSIAFDLGEGVAPPPEAGWLLALEDVGAVGRPEFRFSLG
jgi:sugar lactone lactonase YvrE